MKQFDEKEEEIAEVLISLGMSRNTAMTLAYMQNTNSATSLPRREGSQIMTARSQHSNEADKKT